MPDRAERLHRAPKDVSDGAGAVSANKNGELVTPTA